MVEEARPEEGVMKVVVGDGLRGPADTEGDEEGGRKGLEGSARPQEQGKEGQAVEERGKDKKAIPP